MKLDKYISQLLYQYDCVVVPDLGGFVANYKPASINPLKNTISPPSKGISFNKNLNNNDGLLANFIAQKKNISYDKACAEIKSNVNQIKQKLNTETTIKLEGIGVLFYDAEKRVQFNPENSLNYLLDTYGLDTFYCLPIKKATLEEKITKEFKDRTVPLVAVKNKKLSKKILIAAAVGIPLAILTIWIPTQFDLSNTGYANLNPFKSSLKSTYIAKTLPTKNNNTLNEDSFIDALKEAEKNKKFLNYSFIKGENPTIINTKEKTTEKPISTYVVDKIVELHYHIIGGCFSKKNNAKRMVKRLKKEGFNASIIGKRKGLWTVSYNSFSTRKEAVKALAEAKNNNEKAWILNM